jgi:hypothetical protein
MAESGHLFVPTNLTEFVGLCMNCGPRLHKFARANELTNILNDASARAASESISYKLQIASLKAIRVNDWIIEVGATPQVFTLLWSGSEGGGEATIMTETKEVI